KAKCPWISARDTWRRWAMKNDGKDDSDCRNRADGKSCKVKESESRGLERQVQELREEVGELRELIRRLLKRD
ncbi:MAG: hypothetical protein MK133_16945, partial [Planctomycetes bacterium]|nr:hypothetical protein [Planctomycetota bacterium]